MPLPLLFIIPAIASGVAGAAAGVKAGVDFNEAKKTNHKAQTAVDFQSKMLNQEREIVNRTLENLGREKLFILNKNISKFISIFENIKNLEISDFQNINELSKIKEEKSFIEELSHTVNCASSVLKGVSAGLVGGALTAFGATGAAGAFACASTGTAIASLSGAAATNATLAFFGGGSLAAGGLGVAGGTAVLGGIIAGPAIAVLGIVMGANAKKAKEKALANKAESEKIVEEIRAAREMCVSIVRRANIFFRLLVRLNSKLYNLLLNMEEAAKEHNYNYNDYSQIQKENLAATLSMVNSLKTIMDTAILDENGNLTIESRNLVSELTAIQ